MNKKEALPLGEVLRLYLEQNPVYKKKLAQARVISGWKALLGEGVAARTESIYISRNILYVHISSPALRSELHIERQRLVEKLNSHAKAEVIKDIIIR
jgi:predicted nucleic acid-binding Zn ribbon protein